MLDLYIDNKNSLTALANALRISISNSNNFNTPGFKYSFASFTTTYKEAITSGTKFNNPMHTGTGMTLGMTSTSWEQGNLTIGTALDTAVVGEGLLILSSSATQFGAGAPKVYTRSGRFLVDYNNEYVVDSHGRKVYGYKLDEAGNIISGELVPIKTDGNTDIGFQDGGILVSGYEANRADPSVVTKPLYRLGLTTFQNKQGLALTTGGAYKATVASGESLAHGAAGTAIGGSGGSTYGDLIAQKVEASNVDIAKVALDMNLLNRGFAAVQAVIDDVTKIIQNVMKIVGG